MSAPATAPAAGSPCVVCTTSCTVYTTPGRGGRLGSPQVVTVVSVVAQPASNAASIVTK